MGDPASQRDITLEPVNVTALATRWRALESTAAASPFQTWNFVGCEAGARYDAPFLLAVQADGADLALGLLNLAGGKLHLHATGDARLDGIFAEHSALLIKRGHEGAVAPALSHLLRRNPVVLAGVDDSYLVAARAVGVVTRHQARFAPAIDLTALRGDYVGSLSSNARAQIRRATRLAGDDIVIQRANGVAQALGFFEEMVTLHQASWRARGKPGAFADATMRTFHRALIGNDGPGGIADLLRITAGGDTLGILYNLRHAGWVCCYQSGFRASASPREKPGLLCHVAAVEFYRSEGSMRYDLLAGPERYKTTLARTSGQTLHWFTLHPPGAIGARLRRLAEDVVARVRPQSPAGAAIAGRLR